MEHKFKCKDEVLFRLTCVRNYEWTYGVISHEVGDFVTLSSGVQLLRDKADIIPFAGNEHLVGTTDETGEEVAVKEAIVQLVKANLK